MVNTPMKRKLSESSVESKGSSPHSHTHTHSPHHQRTKTISNGGGDGSKNKNAKMDLDEVEIKLEEGEGRPSEENLYEVDDIRDMKVKDGRRHFLVKWKNYDERENTWEPEENMTGSQVLVDKFLAEYQMNGKGPNMNGVKEEVVMIKEITEKPKDKVKVPPLVSASSSLNSTAKSKIDDDDDFDHLFIKKAVLKPKPKSTPVVMTTREDAGPTRIRDSSPSPKMKIVSTTRLLIPVNRVNVKSRGYPVVSLTPIDVKMLQQIKKEPKQESETEKGTANKSLQKEREYVKQEQKPQSIVQIPTSASKLPAPTAPTIKQESVTRHDQQAIRGNNQAKLESVQKNKNTAPDIEGHSDKDQPASKKVDADMPKTAASEDKPPKRKYKKRSVKPPPIYVFRLWINNKVHMLHMDIKNPQETLYNAIVTDPSEVSNLNPVFIHTPFFIGNGQNEEYILVQFEGHDYVDLLCKRDLYQNYPGIEGKLTSLGEKILGAKHIHKKTKKKSSISSKC